MFGVVLWSDNAQNRAVIWCEDHGNLAFFKGDLADGLSGQDIDPGDLVQFDLTEERQMRLASNPRLVAADEYPTLAQDLRRAGQPVTSLPRSTSADGVSNIVPFTAREREAAVAHRAHQSTG